MHSTLVDNAHTYGKDVPPPVTTAAFHEQSVERVVRWMRENYREELSLDQLAEIANMSRFHFNRVFKPSVPTSLRHFAP